MARQDYVSHSPKSKKNPYKKQPEAAAPILSLKLKLIILLMLLSVGGFAYFLWVIKDKAPLPDTPLAPAKVVVKEKALPAPPKEKWGYMDDLKNKEVEEGEYIVEKKGPYKMQCGSFKTRAQAETLKANIAFAGLTSQIKAVSGSNGTWYKVFLGPYERKRQAEKEKHALRRNNIKTCEIWLW